MQTPGAGERAWLPLESNPDVVSAFAHRMGASPGWKVRAPAQRSVCSRHSCACAPPPPWMNASPRLLVRHAAVPRRFRHRP